MPIPLLLLPFGLVYSHNILHNIRIHIMVGSTWLLRRAGYGALSRAGVSCGPLLAPTGPGRASSGNAGLRPKYTHGVPWCAWMLVLLLVSLVLLLVSLVLPLVLFRL
jgi:hypothetical protein